MTSVDEACSAFETQVGHCEAMGSPFTARILNALIADIRMSGPVADLIAPFETEAIAAALALRVAGAFHGRALLEPTSALGGIYPTCGGDGAVGMSGEDLRELLVADLVAHRDHYGRYLESPPQTNEVGRSAIMIGGYLQIAAETNLPLDVREIGSSAGLNLSFDQFSYQLGDVRLGGQTSRVHLAPKWQGAALAASELPVVRSRMACDIAPLDIRSPETRLRLQSYVWADQLERMERLQGALDIAEQQNVRVEEASADIFVERVLQARDPGAALVISHTVMWQYMPQELRRHIRDLITSAGDVAQSDAPLAWLRFEPRDKMGPLVLQLTLWPGGDTRELAIADPHGRQVKWH